MADNSSIEWTEATWNPVTGCTKISPGCANCYAERMSRRLHAMGNQNYRNGFQLTVQPQMLERPLQWTKSKFVFVNSMSDLFHRDVPTTYIQEVFDVMRRAYWHQFQVLTKRSGRLARVADAIDWPENVWMGVSVEDEKHAFRIDQLRATGAQIKFLSLEPLVGPLPQLDLTDIDWVIVGGESGPGARPMAEDWVVDIRRQSRRAGVAFFFKQWGGVNKKKSGRLLRGKTYDEMPPYTLHKKAV
ncbi:MAG: phage Gp37/Gp68 family protein [Planctomycetota bacterium]|nr:MAG: phage Gp37/Gp68 family protein [Planctomycetota bacterium]REJ92781.1 MAG: phage Gp37/Gp68 family protein [Planctomycetota bacterium]REK23574.1 MAG: phage Gp37/Gp68 family protein [Planctomycetota bacterium]REK44792.1 MAG: phage Gp37/Gp68 family protein [Planctomycetota bacterium]